MIKSGVRRRQGWGVRLSKQSDRIKKIWQTKNQKRAGPGLPFGLQKLFARYEMV